jgi:hypothetical protein
MRRREFITLLGSVVVAIPITARGQRSTPAVVGVLSPEGSKTGMALSKASASLAISRDATFSWSSSLLRTMRRR